MKKTAGILSAAFLGTVLTMTGVGAMAEETAYTVEKTDALSQQALISCLEDKYAQRTKLRHEIESRYVNRVASMSEEDMGAAVTEAILYKERLVGSRARNRYLASASREEKIRDAAHFMAFETLRSLPENEFLDVVISVLLNKPVGDKEAANEMIKEYARDHLANLAASKVMDEDALRLMADDELDVLALRQFSVNPTRRDVEAYVSQMDRKRKIEILTYELVEIEWEETGAGGVDHFRESCESETKMRFNGTAPQP